MLEPASLDATSGRGIQIIATLGDRQDVQSRDGLTRVRFEKHRMQVVPNLRRPLMKQEEEEMQRSARVAG